MGYGDHYRGLYRDYYRDPFPHSDSTKNQTDHDKKLWHKVIGSK